MVIPASSFFMLLRDILAGPITRLGNLSFESGSFLKFLKIATVTPIFKSRSRNDITNCYRPISVVPLLSKIFENAMSVRKCKTKFISA